LPEYGEIYKIYEITKSLNTWDAMGTRCGVCKPTARVLPLVVTLRMLGYPRTVSAAFRRLFLGTVFGCPRPPILPVVTPQNC